MNKIKILIFCLAFIGPISSHAFFELGADFGYKRQVYGAARQNTITDRSYSSSLAWYLFKLTAIEINFTQSEKITIEKNNIDIEGADIKITGMQNKIKTNIYGIGLRQAFASRKSRFRPTISFGYAQQHIDDSTNITYVNTATGISQTTQDSRSRKKFDSAFGSFALVIGLTKTFSLKGSVQTVFKAFEFNRAQDNMKYLVGFTWLF